MQKISVNKSKLSTHYKQINNVANIHSNNTFIHEMLKCAVCKILKDSRHCFVTEARFTSELRADIYDLTEDICFEIICFEKEESIENKRSEYPVREIIPIYSLHSYSYQNCFYSFLETSIPFVFQIIYLLFLFFLPFLFCNFF